MRKYEECFDSARRAKEHYEKADSDLDLSRAQIAKIREVMSIKVKTSDEQRVLYVKQVSSFNENRKIFYEQQLPSVLNELQNNEAKHSDDFKQACQDYMKAHSEVLPRIQSCLTEISKKTDEINAAKDTDAVIEEYRTGLPVPGDVQPVRNFPNVSFKFSTANSPIQIDLNNVETTIQSQNEREAPIYEDLQRSTTLRSTSSEPNSGQEMSPVYAIGNIHQFNNTQPLTPVSEGSQRKRNGKPNTIRKIFGNSNQRKVNRSIGEISNFFLVFLLDFVSSR